MADLEKENKKLREMIKLLQEEDSGRSVELLNEENIELEKILSKHKDRIVQEETKKQIAQNRSEMLRAEQKLLKDMLITGEGDIENQKAKVKILKEALKTQKEFATAVKEGEGAAKDLGASLGSAMRVTRGGVVDVGKMAAGMGKVAKLAKGLASGSFKDGLKSLGTFVATLGGNILISILQIFVDLATAAFKLAFAIEDTTRAMQQATGMSRKLADSISAGIPKVRKYTHEFKILAEASTALYRGFTDFTLVNATTARDLAENAAMLSRMGVSYDSFTGSVQMATKGMGVAAEDGSAMMRNLTAHAENIGTDIGQLTSAFAESGSTLTKYGNDGVEAFKRLSMTSKITGIDIQRLLAITEKFDTFEGAAEQAGMLNAALGGNFVNAMDLMMETDPRARFDMIRDSIMGAAGSFDDMTYYQKIYMAKAAGLKDVGELALMMSGNYELLDENMGKNSDSYIDQAKKAREWQSTMEQLKTQFMELVPHMKEPMELFKKLLIWLGKDGGDAIKELFTSIQTLVTTIAKEENLEKILSTTSFLVRNLPAIAGGIASIVALITGANVFLFFKSLSRMKGMAKTIEALGKAAQGGGLRPTGGAPKLPPGTKPGDVLPKGSKPPVRGGLGSRGGFVGSRQAAQAAAARRGRGPTTSSSAAWARAEAEASRKAAAKAAKAGVKQSGRMGTAWKGITTWSRAMTESLKASLPSMAKLGDKSSKMLKVVKGWGPAAKALGPKVAKVLGPVGLLGDAYMMIKGGIEGAGKELDGWQAPMHRAKTGFDRMSSAIAGMFEGMAAGFEWIGKKIRPDWLSDLLGSDEPLADISNLEAGVSDKMRAQQVKIQIAMLERAKKAGLKPSQLMDMGPADQERLQRDGLTLGQRLQDGVEKGASDLVPGSLSKFAEGVVLGIAAAEDPIYEAMTAPFVRAEEFITKMQENIVKQAQLIAEAASPTVATATPPATADAAANPGKQPVVVQIHMNGVLTQEEVVGTIGMGAGFSGITGYSFGPNK